MRQLQARVFQVAIEIALSAVCPQGLTMNGLVDKLACASARPEQAKRQDYTKEEWARDFLHCLPQEQEAQRLLLLCYLPVYVCRCNVVHFSREWCADCGTYPEPYRWGAGERQRCGGISKNFWQRVQDRRLFGRGIRESER